MTAEGFEAVFVETHNWGRAARFLQGLGFELEFSTGDNSSQLRNGDGPYLFIAEVPADREPQVRIALKVADADEFRADPDVEVSPRSRTPSTGPGRWPSVTPTAARGACRPRSRADVRDNRHHG
jgi:hypothetical protein